MSTESASFFVSEPSTIKMKRGQCFFRIVVPRIAYYGRFGEPLYITGTIVNLGCWRMKVGALIVCISLVLVNIHPPVDISPTNSDGPTFPLEVLTDKYYYVLGETVSITLRNVGDEKIQFLWYPYDYYFVGFEGNVVVDTRQCWPRLTVIVEIEPSENITDEWNQKYSICDESNDPVPPTGDEVPPGKYRLSIGMDYAAYGEQPMQIWDSVWIEIGLGNEPPIADAGPDQTVNVGDVVQFDGSGSFDPDGEIAFGKSTRVNDVVKEKQTRPSIAVDSEGNIHVAWTDGRNALQQRQSDVYYSKSTDGGRSFQTSVRVHDDIEQTSQIAPALVVNEKQDIFVVWMDSRDSPPSGVPEGSVYFTKSTDQGQSFWPDLKVNDDDGDCHHHGCTPAIGLFGNRAIFVAWSDRRVGASGDDIYFSRSLNGGYSFEPDVRVSDDTGWLRQALASMDVDQWGNIYLAFLDTRNLDQWGSDIYFSKSTNRGISFEPNVRVNNDTDNVHQWDPAIAVDADGNINVVWESPRADLTGADVHLGRSTDAGLTFGESVRVNEALSPTSAAYPDIETNPFGDIYVVWGDKGVSYLDVFFSVSRDGGKTFGKAIKVNDYDQGDQWVPSITVDQKGIPHIVYQDYSRNESDIYYARGSTPLTYDWDFGDGSVHSVKVRPTHVYDHPGVYNVTLVVTDELGASHSDYCVVTVLLRNQPPVANANGPYYVDEGYPITLDGSGSHDPDNDTLQYRWDLNHDGIWDTNWSLDPTVVNIWMDDGTYTVALEVKDAFNDTDTDNVTVYVSDLGPTAGFTWFPEPQDEGSPVQFSDSSESYPDAIVSWHWDFGDLGVSNEQNPNHTYGDNGNYPVTLTVKDDDGSTDSISHTVEVLNVAPIADAGEDKEGYEVSMFLFNGSCNDPGIYDTHTYEWDFDYDGMTFDVEAVGQSVSHTWIDDFDGDVALRVADDDGGVGIDTVHVLVKNVPPTVELEVLPIEVDVSLRIAGEKWHDVSIELYEDDVLIAEGTLTRYPGSPNDQMLDLSHLNVDISREYSAVVRYTPEDDPINGQPNGANPCWIILEFNDGEEVRLHHTFNVQHPETYTWEADLTKAILSHGLTFMATAYDPGADDLTFHWDFGDGTGITNFYPNLNSTFPVEIKETVTHAFSGSGTYTVVLTVEDDDGGVGVAMVTIVIP